MTRPLTMGTAAPDFALDASDGRTYRLHDVLEASNALLVFYPANNTPG